MLIVLLSLILVAVLLCSEVGRALLVLVGRVALLALLAGGLLWLGVALR